MIGVLIPEFPSQTHAFFWREIQALRAMAVDVSIFSTRKPPADACRHAFGPSARDETVYLYPPRFGSGASLAMRPSRLSRALGYLASLHQTGRRRKAVLAGLILCAEELRRAAAATGVTHIHAHSCADAAHVAALCRLMGGPPYSLTLHGDLGVYGGDHDRKMAGAKFVATAGAHLIDSVVRRAGLPTDRVQSVWMGLDTAAFFDAGLRRPVAGRLHLATVARLERTKGHHHALAALKLAAEGGLDVRYTIAGAGPYRPAIEAEIDRLGLRGLVELVGSLSETEVIELMQRADAFVLSSYGEGEAAPVSVMEAMACGMAVVCSVIGSTPDMIADGVDGLLVAQGDEAGLASAFSRLSTDPDLRVRLGSAARTRALANFDSRASAARLLGLIRGGRPD